MDFLKKKLFTSRFKSSNLVGAMVFFLALREVLYRRIEKSLFKVFYHISAVFRALLDSNRLVVVGSVSQ